jgi:hypothetical protein
MATAATPRGGRNGKSGFDSETQGLAPCPTGVLLFASSLITRGHRGESEDAFVIASISPEYRVASDRPVQRFTHSRVIVARNTAITSSGGLFGGSAQPDGAWVTQDIPEGLVFRALDGASDDVIVPVPDCARVTAIASLDREDAFLSGGKDGEIDRWSWEDQWVRHRIQGTQPPQTAHWPDIGRLVWVTYKPTSIVGLVTVSRPDMWASVTAGGELTIRHEAGAEPAWQLPLSGTPRSIAAHPERPWLAIAIKQGSDPPSAVAIVDVS